MTGLPSARSFLDPGFGAADDDEDLYKLSYFVRLDVNEMTDLVLLACEKKIQYRDISVLLLLVAQTDWRDGKCRLTCQRVAELMDWSPGQVAHSFRRLKSVDLIVPLIDRATGTKIHIFNPRLVLHGTGKRRGYLIKSYKEVLNEKTASIQSDDEQAGHS